jgi:hypothetical protein
MTSREQFEVWFKPRKERMKSDGICTLNIVRYRGMAWAGWQASRDAVEVELPSLKQIDSGERYVWSDGVFNFKEDAIKAIRAAGIKVKGE